MYSLYEYMHTRREYVVHNMYRIISGHHMHTHGTARVERRMPHTNSLYFIIDLFRQKHHSHEYDVINMSRFIKNTQMCRQRRRRRLACGVASDG